jgi:hypothetical protein
MTKPNLEDHAMKVMITEDKIIDYKVSAMRVDKAHWMFGYFMRRYEEKVKEWEKLTGKKYDNC